MRKIVIFSSKSGNDAKWIHLLGTQSKTIKVVAFVTNNSKSPLIDYGMENNIPVFCIPENPTLMRYISCFINLCRAVKFDTILLMGYMRIVPREVCEAYKIYNLHPGDVIKYPQLKGKDPQKKAIELKLPSTGVVIHEVTEEVDGGQIVLRKTIDIDPEWKDSDLIFKLVDLAREAWREFLEI